MDIYLDHAATTPLSGEAGQAIEEAIPLFGNPSSLHRLGVRAEQLISEARKAVLRALGAKDGTIVFTGCGTESNNLAILGASRQFAKRGRHLVTTAIEHPSVLEPIREMEKQGWSVTFVPPESDGSVTAASVLDALREDTVLVSMMHVNNETGALLPVQEVGEALAQRPKTLFHVDGIQAFGKVPMPLRNLHVDLYSISGHKVGAPKGIGGLFIRKDLRLQPVLFGGGQEFGLRSGTENTLGIAALGRAAQAAATDAEGRWEHMNAWKTRFAEALSRLPKCRIVQPKHSSPYILTATFPGLRGEVLVHALESAGVYASTGSACSSKGGHAKASHVLQAMGLSARDIGGAVRFSFGRDTTERDMEEALRVIAHQVSWLYSLER